MRSYEIKNGSNGASRDGSFIPYIVEELIARSAYQVVFNYDSESFKKSITPALNNRVDWVNSSSAYSKSTSFLSPLFEEFNLGKEGYGYFNTTSNESLNENQQLLMSLDLLLEKFYLAIEECLQLDINLLVFRNIVENFRNMAKSNEARGRLAVLEGILYSYELCETPCLITSSNADDQLVEYFQRLSEDSEYLEISQGAHSLGYVEKTKRAIEVMRRSMTGLLNNKYFSKGFNQSAKAISLATNVHVPETELAESFLSRGYLPPVISLHDPLVKAEALWRAHNPPLIHFDDEINKEKIISSDIDN